MSEIGKFNPENLEQSEPLEIISEEELKKLIEQLDQEGLIMGWDYFVRNPKEERFYVSHCGDLLLLGKGNMDAEEKIKNGYLKVKYNENKEPIFARLTEKYQEVQEERTRKGRESLDRVEKSLNRTYFGWKIAEAELIAMDKEENFSNFLLNWFKDEFNIKDWDLELISMGDEKKQNKRSQYKLGVYFEKGVKYYQGNAQQIVDKVKNDLDEFYPSVANIGYL